MNLLILLLSAFSAPHAQAGVIYTCGCTMYVMGEPEALVKSNWLFSESQNKAAATASARSLCRKRYGKNPPTVFCQASQLTQPRARQKRPQYNPLPTTSPAEQERISREAHEYIEEIREKNRRDQVRKVLQDARNRGVILPGDYN